MRRRVLDLLGRLLTALAGRGPPGRQVHRRKSETAQPQAPDAAADRADVLLFPYLLVRERVQIGPWELIRVFDRDDEPIRLPVRLVILTNCEGEHRVATWLAALAKNLELSARAAAGILGRFLQLPVDRSVHRLSRSCRRRLCTRGRGSRMTESNTKWKTA
jgi:hypothetical protein